MNGPPTASDLDDSQDYPPLSTLNTLLYCDRRAALRHLDGLYVHNEHTRRGEILHSRADASGVERRPRVRTERGLWIVSHRLRLYGRADLVEFRPRPGGVGGPGARGEVAFPVEYKRGRHRDSPGAKAGGGLKRDNDDVQLCAQALCLEEMLGTAVPEGAIYYAQSRKRRVVPLTESLRAETEAAVARLHALLASGSVPPAILKPQCRGCSLRGHCLPEAFAHPRRWAALGRDLFSPHLSDPP